jgi:acyl-coenzyme A synthetase/AMP-(fatty) acid ligase
MTLASASASAALTDNPTAPSVPLPDFFDLPGLWPFNIIYSSGTTGTPKGIVQPHAMRWAPCAARRWHAGWRPCRLRARPQR